MLDVASVSRALQAAADVGIDMPASVLYQFSPEHSSAAAERFFTEAGVAVPATGERAVLTLDQLWWSLNRIAAKELFEKVRREMGVQGNGGREEIAVGVCDREREREREKERESGERSAHHTSVPPSPFTTATAARHESGWAARGAPNQANRRASRTDVRLLGVARYSALEPRRRGGDSRTGSCCHGL